VILVLGYTLYVSGANWAFRTQRRRAIICQASLIQRFRKCRRARSEIDHVETHDPCAAQMI
jgi:hypothetical protein